MAQSNLRTGRPDGAKDKPPHLPVRKTARILRDLVSRAEAGDPVAIACLAGASLIAKSANAAEVADGQ